MNLVDKNGKEIKPLPKGDDWKKAIDYCIDNFDKEEAKNRIKKYVEGLNSIYHERLKQAAMASILNDKSILKK